jgi:hypothetical protein
MRRRPCPGVSKNHGDPRLSCGPIPMTFEGCSPSRGAHVSSRRLHPVRRAFRLRVLYALDRIHLAPFKVADGACLRILATSGPSSRSPRRCDDSFAPRVRCRRGRAHPLFPGCPPFHQCGCDDPFTSRVQWPSRIARRPPPGHPRDRRPGCDASFTSHSRGRQELVIPRLRDILRTIRAPATTPSPRSLAGHRGHAHRLRQGHPPFHPPGCVDRVARAFGGS